MKLTRRLLLIGSLGLSKIVKAIAPESPAHEVIALDAAMPPVVLRRGDRLSISFSGVPRQGTLLVTRRPERFDPRSTKDLYIHFKELKPSGDPQTFFVAPERMRITGWKVFPL